MRGRPSFPSLLKLDVKGLASYIITSSNDSALVFPRIVGVDGETKSDGRSCLSFVQRDACLEGSSIEVVVPCLRRLDSVFFGSNSSFATRRA
jgi:hypothetical protein